ncbi:MAG: aliphatic sulfonate ABC transporter substrate-binding protein [Betaproteobacteria bacterium]|nr:aliphatic sulfonate ABC transporter substrate-binding protein [Betaproteobacteria bacterium]
MMGQKLTRRKALGVIGGSALSLLYPGFARAAPVIRIGYQATLASAVDVIAIEEKLYEKVGVKTTTHKFDAGRGVRDAMVAGAIDLGGMAVVPFIVGASKGEMVAVAVSSFFGATILVQVKPDSPIKRMEELRGKKIGTAVGSLTHNVLVERVAPAFGLKKGDYQVVNIGFGNLIAALTAGTVDAVTALDPYAGLAEHEKLARTLVSYEKFDLSPNMLVVRAAFLQQNENDVVAALKPWLAAAKMFRENTVRAAAILQREYERQGYKVPDAVMRQGVSRLRVAPEITPEARKYLADMANVLKSQGQIAQIPEWETRLRPDLLRRAQT